MELDGIREFAIVVGYLNQIFAEGEALHFIHWDFQKCQKESHKKKHGCFYETLIVLI